MQQRHQLMAAGLEYQPRPGEREILWPSASLKHQQRAGHTAMAAEPCVLSKEEPL